MKSRAGDWIGGNSPEVEKKRTPEPAAVGDVFSGAIHRASLRESRL
jgi:hypothetical protein